MPEPMPKPSPRTGMAVCRLTLELIRNAAHALFGDGPAAPRAVDVLLLAAVCVGAVEGRPMNAGKLAHFSDVPRPTAVRRLAALQRGGYVSRMPCGRYEPGPALTPEAHRAAAEPCIRAIQRAAAELSRLDT